MSASATVLANFGRNQWNARVYGSLSIASRIASLVKDRRQAVRLAFLLRKLNNSLASFFEEIYLRIEGKIPPQSPAEPLTAERAQNALHSLRELSTSLFETYEGAKSKRLTNNSLLAGPFSRLRTYSEDISELADWLEMSLDLKPVEEIFERARLEAEQGDVFNIKQAL